MTARPDPDAVLPLRPAVDCVVVGGGPVGLLTALFLGQAGLRVSVVERWPQRYPSPRACTIDHEALRILQAAGLMAGHADLFEPSQGERGGYEFRNGAGELLQTIDWNRPAESGWANTNGFYQPDLEAALEDLAVATPGVTVHRGWTFRALTQDRAGVRVRVAPAERPAEVVQLRSRWVVGADGASSPVRTQLGIDVGDSGFQADWLVVDYQPLAEEKWTAFVTQYCDPAQPATAVNSGPGRRRFEFMRRADMTVEELGRDATAWRLMTSWGVTPQTARLERHAVYTFRGQWAQTWRKGNVFLAGDAAHLMPPFLGQGLCAGLRDARALSWRLGLVHHGLATPAVLDTYGPERSGHVREIIDEAVAAGRVICELDRGRAAARDAEMKQRSLDPGAATREPPHPRLGEPSLTVAGGGAEGRLAPQGRVQVAHQVGLFDDIVGGRWQLVSRAGDPAGLLGDEDASWFRQIGGMVADVSGKGPVRDLDGAYQRWFAKHGCEAFLARPDFYVFAAGEHTDIPRFVSRLRQALQPGLALARGNHGGRSMTATQDPQPNGELPQAHRPRPGGSFDATVITFAAIGLFDGLTADQRARVLLPQADPGRTHWNFLPESGRHGLPLGELDRHQETLAHRLIAESMSVPAYARVIQVMANEHVLRELNLPVFGHVAATFRDARGYFLTFFGQPQPDTTWGWRLVGHHLSVNVTVVDGDLVSATPFLLGAEPARFGPFRILGEEEDAAFALLDSLTGPQQQQAVIHSRPPADFVTRTVAAIGEVEFPAYHGVGRRDAMITDVDRKALAYFRAHPRGIRAGDLSPAQRGHFDDLLARFVERARPGLVGFEMDRIAAAGGVGELHFAWAGGTSIDQPHYFRIQGPATLVEFDNAEDNANHVHSVWRDPANDFGADLLIQHHLEHDHTVPSADDEG